MKLFRLNEAKKQTSDLCSTGRLKAATFTFLILHFKFYGLLNEAKKQTSDLCSTGRLKAVTFTF